MAAPRAAIATAEQLTMLKRAAYSVLYTFEAQDACELSVSAGDLVVVQDAALAAEMGEQAAPPGWLFARLLPASVKDLNKAMPAGYVPESYLSPPGLPPAAESEQKPSKAQAARRSAMLRGKLQKVARRAIIASWLAAGGGSEDGDDAKKGAHATSADAGAAVAGNPVTVPITPGGAAKVLYSFTAETPGEVTVQAGDIVSVLSDQSLAPPGWTLVHKPQPSAPRGYVKGFVPEQYVAGLLSPSFPGEPPSPASQYSQPRSRGAGPTMPAPVVGDQRSVAAAAPPSAPSAAMATPAAPSIASHTQADAPHSSLSASTHKMLDALDDAFRYRVPTPRLPTPQDSPAGDGTHIFTFPPLSDEGAAATPGPRSTDPSVPAVSPPNVGAAVDGPVGTASVAATTAVPAPVSASTSAAHASPHINSTLLSMNASMASALPAQRLAFTSSILSSATPVQNRGAGLLAPSSTAAVHMLPASGDHGEDDGDADDIFAPLPPALGFDAIPDVPVPPPRSTLARMYAAKFGHGAPAAAAASSTLPASGATAHSRRGDEQWRKQVLDVLDAAPAASSNDTTNRPLGRLPTLDEFKLLKKMKHASVSSVPAGDVSKYVPPSIAKKLRQRHGPYRRPSNVDSGGASATSSNGDLSMASKIAAVARKRQAEQIRRQNAEEAKRAAAEERVQARVEALASGASLVLQGDDSDPTGTGGGVASLFQHHTHHTGDAELEHRLQRVRKRAHATGTTAAPEAGTTTPGKPTALISPHVKRQLATLRPEQLESLVERIRSRPRAALRTGHVTDAAQDLMHRLQLQ